MMEAADPALAYVKEESPSPSAPSSVSSSSPASASSKQIKEILNKRISQHPKRRKSLTNVTPDYISLFLLFLVVMITLFTYPDWTAEKVSIQHVWYYGWITAISTGVGVLPFFFLSEPDKFWMAISNGRFDIELTEKIHSVYILYGYMNPTIVYSHTIALLI
jgi:hypothetical protein